MRSYKLQVVVAPTGASFQAGTAEGGNHDFQLVTPNLEPPNPIQDLAAPGMALRVQPLRQIPSRCHRHYTQGRATMLRIMTDAKWIGALR